MDTIINNTEKKPIATKKTAKMEVVKERWTKFHEVEKYLSDKYDLRYNEVANSIEISIKNKNDWTVSNPDTLFVELQKKGINMSRSNIVSIIKSDFVEVFNPLKAYFKNLHKWNCTDDYIKQYTDFLILSPNENRQQIEYHFKKWCVRAVKCAIIDGYYNKQAFILSDNGIGQDIGKTSYLKNLCPAALQYYIQTNLPRDNKDAKIALSKNFLINLDELANLQKQEVNSLKSLFSETSIKVRPPFGDRDINAQRTANFIGSTNNVTFLNDESGSVRWICFLIEGIKFEYRNNFNIDNLWSQAYALAYDKTFDENISKEDIRENELRNEKYQTPSPEKELIFKYFKKPTEKNKKHYTATEILHQLSIRTVIRLNLICIGKAMTSLKFNRVKNGGIYVYEVEENFDL